MIQSQKINQQPEGEEYATNYTSKSRGNPDPQQAFVIEFFGDTLRKKRSQSFTNNVSSPDFQSAIKSKLDKLKRGERSTLSGHNPSTQQFTIPLKGSDGPPRAGSLRREESEVRMSTSDSSSRSSSKTYGSVGRRSKLSQDFAAELLRVSKPSPAPTWDVNSTWVKTSSRSSVTHQSFPTTSHTVTQTIKSPSAPEEDHSTEAKPVVPKQQEEEDSLSDAGTYTVEAESPDKEVVEARSSIDQVLDIRFKQLKRPQTHCVIRKHCFSSVIQVISVAYLVFYHNSSFLWIVVDRYIGRYLTFLHFHWPFISIQFGWCTL